jgi:beta-galactosidase
MTDAETVNNFTSYVEGGGTLYATYLLGMVNDTDLCYLGGFPANGLKEVFGIWNEELDTLYPDERVKAKMNDGREYLLKDCCELIHAKGAEVLASYATEFYAGRPMLTVNKYGKGKAYYQAARDCGEMWEDMCGELLEQLCIASALPEKQPEGVVAHIREDGETRYLFLQNFRDEAVANIKLDGTYRNMETGEIASVAQLGAFDVKIFKKL